MKYITVSEAAEKWGVSKSLVRRYLAQNRIPKAKCDDGIWSIPETAKKPPKLPNTPVETEELCTLASKLVNQKKKRNYHGLYDYVVINLTYSSCRMASNRLTRGQVETVFKKGKVSSSFEPLKVSDLIETLNHCMCVDYILDHIQEPLTQKFIQNLHYMLMIGTIDERKERVTPGEYRTDRMKPRNRRLLPAKKINSSLGELLREYEARKRVDRSIIRAFHVRFEQIFPFEDGNGRVGRLIMFKECLRYDVMPFILDDKSRTQYLAGIQDWASDRWTLTEVAQDAQNRFEAQVELQKLAARRGTMMPDMYEEDDV